MNLSRANNVGKFAKVNRGLKRQAVRGISDI